MRRMPVKISRKHSASRTTSAPKGRGRTYSERWDLSDLVEKPVERFEALLGAIEANVAQFEAARSRLSPTMEISVFLPLLTLSENITAASSKIGAYAYLWFSENTKDLAARSFKTKVEERLTALQNRLVFFDLWWQSVDENNARRLMAGTGTLRYHLETIRRFKPHTLSEPEEKIINIKNVTGRSAVQSLYDVVTNSFTFTLTVNGKRKMMTREELTAYLRHAQGRLREAAYRELYRVYADQHDLLGEIYKTLVNDWKAENLQVRRFASPIATRNLGNDISDEAVASLLKVCQKNAGVFQHYFRIKARLCNITPMSRYHIYAPHRTEQKSYRYQDAVRMVLDAYRGFSPQLAELAERVVHEHHIDTKTRPGKIGGAYCYSIVPSMTPYVLLNFTGEARDIATMAHELGHAVHGMLAARHSIFTFHSTLPLAETASVFGERILSDALMNQERDKKVRQGLLVNQLDDIYATVLRQAYFVQFENQAHEMIAQGATVKDLAKTYLAEVRQQFGKNIKVPEEFQWEWLTIPHIFASPFYCYAYSFGNLLVLALYRMYQKEGTAFVPKYLDLLSTGGSETPQRILAKVGVDMASEDFWQSGFDTIREMVGQLEQTL
ncbi:MAG TPA: M3 family oligoendopeptidase [Nitrospiraceae bacterium]|nr:M3 family oligoendopeptidase [Nitrospiraceae bacterium]